MLSRRNRLLRGEIELVFKKGKRIHGALFSAVCLPATSTKYATVVSKTVAKNATQRNSVRRRVNHTLRKALEQHNHAHVIVLVRRAALRASSQELQADLKNLFVSCGQYATNRVE